MHTITIARVEEGQELAHGCADRDGWAWRCTCQGGPHGSLMVYGDHDGAEDGAALHLAAVFGWARPKAARIVRRDLRRSERG